jgi:hypothetical protein
MFGTAQLQNNEVIGTCDASGVSTLHFTDSGDALGPYPGTFTETVDATIGPQTGPPISFSLATFATGPVLSFSVSFTIISGDTIITGTKSGVSPGSTGACAEIVAAGFPSRIEHLEVGTMYQATIATPTGSFSDSGIATARLNRLQINPPSGGSANQNLELFTSTQSEPTPLGPATVTLSPPDAVNTVSTMHTVTATVTNSAGGPVATSHVLFRTTGSSSATGTCTTDAAGQCSFSYVGPDLPGADIISGCADANGNGVVDNGEPCGDATKAWTLPTSTAGQTTGGGQIPNNAGTDQIAFGYNAKATTGGIKGNCTLVDPSPSTDIKFKCDDVTSLVQSGTHATFFGHGTLNGVATTYRIDVDDLGEPGAGHDVFRFQTGTGYGAGGTITHGNIQVHG